MSAKDGRQGSWIKANVIKESHGRPIWCVCFNTEQPEHADLFATVGENTVNGWGMIGGSSFTNNTTSLVI